MTDNSESTLVSYLIGLKNPLLEKNCWDPRTFKKPTKTLSKEEISDLFNQAREKISKYKEIKIINDKLRIALILVAESSKEDFERLYNVKLEYKTVTVNNAKTGSYQALDWFMIGIPQVPEDLENLVSRINLNKKVFLT